MNDLASGRELHTRWFPGYGFNKDFNMLKFERVVEFNRSPVSSNLGEAKK